MVSLVTKSQIQLAVQAQPAKFVLLLLNDHQGVQGRGCRFEMALENMLKELPQTIFPGAHSFVPVLSHTVRIKMYSVYL